MRDEPSEGADATPDVEQLHASLLAHVTNVISGLIPADDIAERRDQVASDLLDYMSEQLSRIMTYEDLQVSLLRYPEPSEPKTPSYQGPTPPFTGPDRRRRDNAVADHVNARIARNSNPDVVAKILIRTVLEDLTENVDSDVNYISLLLAIYLRTLTQSPMPRSYT